MSFSMVSEGRGTLLLLLCLALEGSGLPSNTMFFKPQSLQPKEDFDWFSCFVVDSIKVAVVAQNDAFVCLCIM